MRTIEKWEQIKKTQLRKHLSLRLLRDLETLPLKDKGLNINSSYYIHGLVGSGKTVIAAQLFEVYLRTAYLNAITVTAEFITVPELLQKFRNCFNDKAISENDLILKYSNCDYLVLDDFGAEKSTDYSLQCLYLIINNRYEKILPTVFTSNYDLDELADKLQDDRIPSRIGRMCVIIHKTPF